MKKFNQQIFDICGKKFTLQDVFETACEYLSLVEDNYEDDEMTPFSCDAIKWALWKHLGYSGYKSRLSHTFELSKNFDKIWEIVETGMVEVGFDQDGFYSLDVYSEVNNPQQARFIWLTWLAMMAEEQGV